MKRIDHSLLEAAESMGVFGFKRMITVILPLLVPTLLAAALLVFMRAFSDFGTPMLIGEDIELSLFYFIINSLVRLAEILLLHLL